MQTSVSYRSLLSFPFHTCIYYSPVKWADWLSATKLNLKLKQCFPFSLVFCSTSLADIRFFIPLLFSCIPCVSLLCYFCMNKNTLFYILIRDVFIFFRYACLQILFGLWRQGCSFNLPFIRIGHILVFMVLVFLFLIFWHILFTLRLKCLIFCVIITFCDITKCL